MVLTGYPVEDLALRASFVDASRGRARAARRRPGRRRPRLPAGGRRLPRPRRRRRRGQRPGRACCPRTAPAVLHGGRVVARYAKHHLPNYGVFDEYRIFAPGTDLTVVRVGDIDVAIAICEDLWQEGGPVALTREAGAELLLVINGSPYEQDKDDTRLELCARRAGAGRLRAGLPQPRRRPGRARLRRRLDGGRTRPAPCSPAARSSSRTCWSSTSTCREHRRPAPARPRASCTSPSSDQPIAPYAAEPAPTHPRLDPVGEV